MRSMYETERSINECQSFIMQLRIDQKSMPPSNKKRDLKTRICDYNSKYYSLEQKFKKMQLNFKTGDDDNDISFDSDELSDDSINEKEDRKLLNESCDMEFETASQKSINDKEMQVEGGNPKQPK